MIASERGRHPHEDFDELAVGWALDALEPDDEVMFARHLAGCGRCRQTVAEAHEVTAAITNALPAEAPPASLRDRILAAASVEAQQAPLTSFEGSSPADSIELGADPAGRHRVLDRRRPNASDWSQQRRAAMFRRRRRQRRRQLIRGAGVAAVLALLVGLGVWNVELRSERSDIAAVAAAQQEALRRLGDNGVYQVASLSDMSDNRHLGSLVIHDGQALVLANGLAPNDTSDQTFVLWGLDDDLPAVALGTFDVLTTGLSTRAVESTHTGLDQYENYAISIEPGRQAPSQPTDIVASGAVGS